ncbi:MAG TPA: DUF3987 domain-containing protein [Scandinavium sp.]|uniref:DUF3987 domain-containing protein n=1 Tax=Scandinavium sp. TaxID=2830653 RepID=UPI002E37C190|nr:DUF3987 domain-containing protein [Scandinavium sp.]HEX4500590.1 DUF3987 domain-containing protein [Scandinavium sp.]
MAGVLERKVWVQTGGDSLYPNLYVILVTPPGVGKTVMLTQVERLWREISELHVAPTSITRAALVDSLFEAKRTIVDIRNQQTLNFNSLLVVSGELGVLIPVYDSEFMNSLTAIYDGAPYDERRRTAKLHIKIEKPQLNLLAATTPSYLNNLMPDGAWDQGFISRTILVYCGDREIVDVFTENVFDLDRMDLVIDLKAIFGLHGRMTWTDTARDIVRDFHLADGNVQGMQEPPKHLKLNHYKTRRTAHLIKLCMVACASRGNDMLINDGDVGCAFGWLLGAERVMPEIFSAISSGGDHAIIEDAALFIQTQFFRTGKPVPEYALVSFLKNRVPAHNVLRMIDIMARAKIVKAAIGQAGGIVFSPGTQD